MRILILLLLMDRQIRWLFRDDGEGCRFHPGGRGLPGIVVDAPQRRRIERHMPRVYVWLIGSVAACNLAAVAGIMLWDRYIGYVGAPAAVAVFAAVLAVLGGVLHGWLYVSVRRIVKGGPE